MNLSPNIKRLRRNADLTQEQLADVLGVSFQSVSKWERGDGMPDITLLPAIAQFFKITVDDLLGMDAERRKQESGELYEKRKELWAAAERDPHGAYNEEVALLRSHVKKYPLDWKILKDLAWLIFSYGAPDETEEADRIRRWETVEILRRVVDYCDDTYEKYEAINMMLSAMNTLGGGDPATKEKMRRITESLPPVEFSREVMKASVERDTPSILDAIDALYEAITGAAMLLALNTPEEQARVEEFKIKLTHLLYGHDLCSRKLNIMLMNYHLGTATILRETDVPRALENLKLAAECAVRCDGLPPENEQPTALIPHVAGRPAKVRPNERVDGEQREFLREYLQGYFPKNPIGSEDAPRMKHDVYAPLYGNPEFKAIVESLKP